VLFLPDRLHEEDAILLRIKNGEIVEQYETVRVAKDGAERQISLMASPIVDAAGQIIGISKIIHDITARKQAQEELRTLQAELVHLSRWNMMGMMASSLAHELNQPLTAVLNYVRAARRTLDKDPSAVARIGAFLDKAVDETKLAGGIIQSLREFIQKREARREPEDINRVLEDGLTLSLYIGVAGRSKIAARLTPRLPPVLVDKVQIQQVLLNLVRNALEAMKTIPDGRLIIKTALGAPGFVDVSVSDTGPGLAPDISHKLFQPFVTNKEKGMGVGLSISRTIVESHGGKIWTEPNLPQGVIFHFTIPVIAATDEA
jgi:two-component system sensor kinase FixL